MRISNVCDLHRLPWEGSELSKKEKVDLSSMCHFKFEQEILILMLFAESCKELDMTEQLNWLKLITHLQKIWDFGLQLKGQMEL